MELAMADMAETLTPYNPGDNILEDPDEYSYNDGWWHGGATVGIALNRVLNSTIYTLPYFAGEFT